MTQKELIGKNVKKFREARGLSQRALAELVGYQSSSTLAKVEKGYVEPQTEMLERIACQLGVTLADIMGFKISEDDEYAMLVEAYKRAPINDKMTIKLLLRLPFTKSELEEINQK